MGELPRGHGVLGLITRERHAVVADDIKSHPASVGFPPGHPPMGSFLGVPLKVRGTTFGNLYLTDKPGGFDDDDRATVEALAAAASVAVDNARLYRSARNREDWAEASGAVAAALLGGLDEEEALEVVVRHARAVARADAAVLALPGRDGALVVEVVDGASAGTTWSGWGSPPCERWATPCPARSPTARARPGVLVLVRGDGHRRFGPDDVAGAESFAAQASLSLRLAAERRRGEDRVLLDERARIARDLHDLAVQQLFAVGIELGRLKLVAAGRRRLVGHVDLALDGLDTAVAHIRTTLRPLRPGARSTAPAQQVARDGGGGRGRARLRARPGRPHRRRGRGGLGPGAGPRPGRRAGRGAGQRRPPLPGASAGCSSRSTGRRGAPGGRGLLRLVVRGRRGRRARPAGPDERPGEPACAGPPARRLVHRAPPPLGRDPGGVDRPAGLTRPAAAQARPLRSGGRARRPRPRPGCGA